MARPTVRTSDVNRKIEECAALGATIEEIAFYAGIHRDTLYDWIKKDKKLSDRIQELREKPILLARQTVVNGIKENYANAMDYLQRKRKAEFSLRTEHTGADGKELPTPIVIVNRNVSSDTSISQDK